MKAVGELQILERETTNITLDASFVTALGIREGVVLYGVVPQSEQAGLSQPVPETESRLMTLIVTPLPPGSWSSLIRMSVTIDPKPGSLHSLVKALNELRIFSRHIEDVTGTNLAGELQSGEPIFPSATFVLELPQAGQAPPDLADLHNSLHKVIHNHKESAPAIRQLESALQPKCKGKVVVRWISPMATLNNLAKQRKVAEKLRVVKSQKSVANAICLEANLSPWQRVIWKPIAPYKPYKHSREQDKIVVMPSLDFDEKIIGLYFYEYSNNLVVQFELTTPSLGLEHCWWEYIYNCVQEAGGNVLGSASSARINGRWSALRCTAMFPLFPLKGSSSEEDSKPEEDPGPIVFCFRKLQGDRSNTNAFEAFNADLKGERKLLSSQILPVDKEDERTEEDIANHWMEKSRSAPVDQFESSQLERLVVWDPFEDWPNPRFRGLFAENPFSFTLPLNRDRYDRLYGGITALDARQTRLGLAEAIADRLSQTEGENIAVVGAHRSGKTTVLNLVCDILEKQSSKPSRTASMIPVRITASVTPPHMLFMTILAEVSRQKKGREAFAASLRKSLDKIIALAAVVLKGIEIKTDYFEVKLKEIVEAASENSESADDKLRNLLVLIEEEKRAVLPEFLKLSLDALRDALQSVSDGTRLVVVLDEFSESATWGDPRALAVWRHTIEAEEYSRIRWLFSTTRPVREAAEYSPITNIFLEYNVGSLREDESRLLLDAFSFTAWQKELPGLRPILTHPARMFLIGVTSSLPYLLQVACYHIYERATRTNFPLINKALCRKVILARVLPEIADYLEHQWKQLSGEAQQFIMETLESLSEDLRNPNQFMRFFDRWEVPLERMPPGTLKALDRSGLRGDDGRCVAPLVAVWLLTRAGRPGGPLIQRQGPARVTVASGEIEEKG
jgi:hypothetical protein